jgi:hypothetical protein
MSSWRALHAAILTETDAANLQRLVYETETAIFLRLQELGRQPGNEDELRNLKTAAADLLAIKTQKLGWPDPLIDGASSSANAPISKRP